MYTFYLVLSRAWVCVFVSVRASVGGGKRRLGGELLRASLCVYLCSSAWPAAQTPHREDHVVLHICGVSRRRTKESNTSVHCMSPFGTDMLRSPSSKYASSTEYFRLRRHLSNFASKSDSSRSLPVDAWEKPFGITNEFMLSCCMWPPPFLTNGLARLLPPLLRRRHLLSHSEWPLQRLCPRRNFPSPSHSPPQRLCYRLHFVTRKCMQDPIPSVNARSSGESEEFQKKYPKSSSSILQQRGTSAPTHFLTLYLHVRRISPTRLLPLSLWRSRKASFVVCNRAEEV